MGCRENDYAVWAILGQDDVPVLCTRKEANEWFWSKDRKRSQIKSDHVDGWCIYTSFSRMSLEPDGPPLFWRVGWWTETKAPPFRSGERAFATKEAALEFHASLAAMLRAHGDSALKLLELMNQTEERYPEDDEEGREGADWWKA
jgi:hypothetical protein